MKRICLLILLLSLLVLPVSAAEAETEPALANIPRAPKYCGEAVIWHFKEETGVLTISGSGAMDDFPEGAPWEEYAGEITEVVFAGSIDYIGAYSFPDYDAITAVQFCPNLREIGKRAFYKCDGIAELILPSTFRKFGEECLMYCTGLETIHCLGPMPSFRNSCLWETHADIYYPADSPWPADPVAQVTQAFRECFTIGPEPGEAAQMPAPAPTFPMEITKPTQPETTEPPTEETTQATTAATQPTTAPPQTQPPTEPPTQPPTEPTQAPDIPTRPAVTEPVQESGKQGSSWIGLAIIGLVISAMGLGALIFARPAKGRRGKGKYSR